MYYEGDEVVSVENLWVPTGTVGKILRAHPADDGAAPSTYYIHWIQPDVKRYHSEEDFVLGTQESKKNPNHIFKRRAS